MYVIFVRILSIIFGKYIRKIVYCIYSNNNFLALVLYPSY